MKVQSIRLVVAILLAVSFIIPAEAVIRVKPPEP